MRLKSFHGPTISDAMRQVREALGEDAIIVATRDDETGGVRVTAAIEEASEEPARETKSAASPAKTKAEAKNPETLDVIAAALSRHKITSALTETLMATATLHAGEDPVSALAAAFAAHLSFAPLVAEKSQPPLILIGAPGVGKTLCLARLAARAAMAKKPVAVISADTERAGGREQLAAFMRVLKLDLIEACDVHALREAVEMQPKDALVLIDTFGCNPYDVDEMRRMLQIIEAVRGSAAMALPADMDALDAPVAAKLFKAAGASRILATRMDMARRLGGLMQAAFESKMPLAGFAASAKVTDYPRNFDPHLLAKMTLPPEISGKATPAKAAGGNAL